MKTKLLLSCNLKEDGLSHSIQKSLVIDCVYLSLKHSVMESVILSFVEYETVLDPRLEVTIILFQESKMNVYEYEFQ
jgi:hypothetical protein